MSELILPSVRTPELPPVRSWRVSMSYTHTGGQRGVSTIDVPARTQEEAESRALRCVRDALSTLEPAELPYTVALLGDARRLIG